MLKKLQLRLALLSLLFGSISLVGQNQDWVSMMQDPEANFFETQQAFYSYANAKRQQLEQDPLALRDQNGKVKIPGYKQFKRWEWFMQPRVSPSGERFDPSTAWKEMEKYKQETGRFMAGNWTFIGPQTTPSGGGNGRCNFIRVHPTTPTTIYVGSPSGGLWTSTNGGANWTTNTDQLNQVIGCTDLAFDPVNPQIMYMATGDGDAGDNYSVGLLKSIDGGATWNTTGLSFNASQTRMMSKVLVDPSNGNTIHVATSGGIYRSTDAGATFTLSQAGSFKDMEFMAGNPSTIFACGTQFYRSSDYGQTWTQITSGLPVATSVSRMAIAVSPADANYLYMIVGLPAPNYGTQGFYRSTNAGTSWTNRSTPNIGNQQWYDLCIAMSPTSRDEVVIGGQTQFLRSTNGGTSWSNNGSGTHVDYHDIVFTGATSYYLSCDGGVYETTNSGGSWTDLGNDLAISQMYGFGQSTTNPNLLIQGWQDNGTNRFNGSWAEVMGGDGMLCFISAFNDNNMWGSQYEGSLNRSTNGGNSWSSAMGGITEVGAWVTPWRESPATANTLYAGFVNMWRSTNGGTSWSVMGSLPGTSTIQAIAIAPSNTQVVWAAKGSILYKTTNGGTSWTAITSLPAGNVSYIACHDTDPNKVWVTYSGYTNTNKVYQTTDQGTTWTNLSGSIPNVPVNCITYHNGTNDGLYIGTDVGVFYKDATTSVWQPFSTGLPNVVVTQLEIFYSGNKIRASTYGRGMWESGFYTAGNYAPVANLGTDKLIDCPGTAIQFTDYSPGQPTSWNWSFPGGSPATSTSQNQLVYYNNPGSYNVTLIVSNSNGTDTLTLTNYITIASSPYAAPTTVGDSICSPGGVVNMSATGTGLGTLRWWNAAGGGSMVSTGPTYSPNIAATTTYYVDEDFPAGSTGAVGPSDNSLGAGSQFTANDIRGLYFDVINPIILNSVIVYSGVAGDRTIEILDPQGNVYIDTTVNIPAAPSGTQVTLDLPIYPGNNYFIKCRGLVDLYRNSSGAVYPYTSPSVNITNSNAGTPGYYYFFYDWQYTDIVCNTSRTPVTAVVYPCSSGLDDLFDNGNFNVYPNPNNGSFDLAFTTTLRDDYTITVYNTLGQVVYEEKANNFVGNYSRKINLASNGNGIYMLKVSNGKKESVKKVAVY
ncbi:MAG: glycosyl hydrolase [Bacteroidetes bacterium]|nr:MAG: glycosyl hydrolase [Bacteroidota bacterium]